jgi:hypothetical protein
MAIKASVSRQGFYAWIYAMKFLLIKGNGIIIKNV